MLLAFAASIPVEDAVQFGIGRLSKVIGLAAFATWLAVIFVRGRLRPLTPVHIAASAFVTWSIASYFWSLDPSATLSKCVTLVQMLAVVWLVLDQAHSRFDLIRLMRAFVLGSLLSALVTSLHAHQGNSTLGAKRFATDNAGPNNAGALLAIAVMMALYLLAADPKSRWRWLYRFFLPVGAVGIILSGSRGALVAFAVGLAIALVTTRNLRGGRLLVLAAAGAIALVLVATLVPQATLDRLGTTNSEIQTGTLDKRLLYWRTAFRIWGEQPVQGIGSGSFQDANYHLGNRAAVAHSLYMSVLVETGVVGLGLLLLALGLAAFDGGRLERPDLRRQWFALWATWSLGAAALTWEIRKITWFMIALGVVHASAVRQERRAAALAAATAADASGQPSLPPGPEARIDPVGATSPT